MNRSRDAVPLSNDAGSDRQLRLIFFGMRCAYSIPPLLACLSAEFNVRTVVLPTTASNAPPLRKLGTGATGRSGRAVPISGDIVSVAHECGVPVLDVNGLRHAEVIGALAAHRPDIIAVACFPWRIPATIFRLPTLGCLNVHPSLLPVGRGPEPVFWTLRRGERQTGVTIHQMDAGLDTGPILAQEAIAVPEGIRAPDLEIRLAEIGGHLLVSTIRALAGGTTHATPQEAALATPAPVPSADDFLVPTNLPARWAYNFVRGVAPLGGPLTLDVLATGERFRLHDALAYAIDGDQDAPFLRDGADLLVRFRPGTARLQLAGDDAMTSQ